MHTIWVITKRELQSFFDSLIAYIMLVLFLSFSGFFTWLYGSDIFLVGQATLEGFFGIAFRTLFFFIPALTMRLLAEEKKTGTIEMLLTKSVTDWEVVLGKFLSTLLLIALALAFTIPYVITLAYIGIGLYASSITNNQIVAFLTALFVGLFFQLIFDVLSGNFSGLAGQVLSA